MWKCVCLLVAVIFDYSCCRESYITNMGKVLFLSHFICMKGALFQCQGVGLWEEVCFVSFVEKGVFVSFVGYFNY
jgi:hypothetical protein